MEYPQERERISDDRDGVNSCLAHQSSHTLFLSLALFKPPQIQVGIPQCKQVSIFNNTQCGGVKNFTDLEKIINGELE